MIMGVFLNLIIEFQKIIIGIRDLVGKVAGIMATLLYIMDGSIKTIKSVVEGSSWTTGSVYWELFPPRYGCEIKKW